MLLIDDRMHWPYVIILDRGVSRMLDELILDSIEHLTKDVGMKKENHNECSRNQNTIIGTRKVIA